MQIPKPEVKFRLISWDKQAIGRMFCAGEYFDNSTRHWKLGHEAIRYDDTGEDGSWWTLRTGPVTDYYYIMNVSKKVRMYVSANKDNEAGLAPGIGCYNDQLWQVKVDENKDACKLINYEKGWNLVLRIHSSPNICLVSFGGYNDQLFQFQQCDDKPVVKSISFQLEAGAILGSKPKAIANQSLNNTGSAEQTQRYTVKYTTTKKHSWEYTDGFSVTMEMGLKFSAGIHVFVSAESSFTLGASTEHTWTMKEQVDESEEQTFEFPLVAPAHVKVTAKTVIFNEKWTVPYEMVLLFPLSGRRETSYGKWKGMQAVVIDTQITEKEAQED